VILCRHVIKQESFFYWVRCAIDLSKKIAEEHYSLQVVIHNCNNFAKKHHACSAFTLDEILKMLPDELEDDDSDCSGNLKIFRRSFLFRKNNGSFMIQYIPYQLEIERPSPITFTNENPAEAAGQLLVWCIENGYVKAEEKP